MVSSGGLFISGIVTPGYNFTFLEGLAIALFVAGCFAVLLGFCYWFIGYWQETINIGKPESEKERIIEANNQKTKQYYDEPDIDVGEDFNNFPESHSTGRSSWHPETMFTGNSLKDFGLRQFNDNDDWINMRPGKKE